MLVANDHTQVIHDTRLAVEKCNLDDMEHKRKINRVTAQMLITDALYGLCAHCWSDDD